MPKADPPTVAEWIVEQWGFRGLLRFIRIGGGSPRLMQATMPDDVDFCREMREIGEGLAQD